MDLEFRRRRRRRTCGLAALAMVALLGLSPGRALAQLLTGSLEGRVTSAETGKPVAGVTVTVTGPALPGEQVAFTDSEGRYQVTELPPGRDYTARYYFGDVRVEREGVEVIAGRHLALPVRLGSASTQVLRIRELAPSIDVAGASTGVTLGEDVARNLPIRGRTYESLLALTPGGSTDPVGHVLGGGTGPENGFLLDGLNTTSPSFGLMGTPLSLEFIKQTEVVTSGFPAEYGRSTGGLVNVVTRSGSNDFHGGAWFHYAPLSLDPRLTTRLGEAIAVRARGGGGPGGLDFLDRAMDFGFDLGGPIVRDRVWFYVGLAPSVVTQSYDRQLRLRVADTADEARQGGATDPGVSCPGYLRSQDAALCVPASTAVVRTVPAGDAYTRRFESSSRLYNYIAKLTFRLSDDHHVTLSYVGSPSTFDGVGPNPRSPIPTGVGLNADPAIVPYQNDIQVHDVVGRLTSKLWGHRLLLDVIAGYHHEQSTVKPSAVGTAGSSVVDFRTNASLYALEGAAPCRPTTVGGQAFDPCPVSGYQYGGFGAVSSITSQRLQLAAALTWFAHAAGTHAVKLGVDLEENLVTDHEWYTGGAAGGRFFRDDTGISRRQYGTVGADGSVISFGSDNPDQAGFTARSAALNYGVYLRDAWTLGFLPGFTVNAGLRWEAQELKDASGATRLGIYDNLAPRVGFAYDFLGSGRAKAFASYSRYYESIPLDVANRFFGGGGIIRQGGELGRICSGDLSGRIDVTACRFGAPTSAQVLALSTGLVAPGIKGQYVNEVIAGLQWDVGWDVVLGAAYIHRDLGRVIDDLVPDGNLSILGNPGEADAGAQAGLARQIDAADARIAATTDPAARAALVASRDAMSQRLQLAREFGSYPRPRRDYNAVQLTASRRLGERFLLIASYTYSRTVGNYPGLYAPSTGQLNPNTSALYDQRQLLVNGDGPLPQDRPHNLKLAGAYQIPLARYGALTVGLMFSAISGAPIDVLGANANYGPGAVFILPRGAGGRTPTVTQLDLHLGWGRAFTPQLRVEITADVFNLLDQQEVTAVDQSYTNSFVGPLSGGTYADLRSLKTIDGIAPVLNPSFGQPIAYQAPLSFRFGARVSF